MKKLVLIGAAFTLAVGFGVSQQRKLEAPRGPKLFHVWSDAQGETHIAELQIAPKRHAAITGTTMNFPAVPAGPGGEKLHNTPARQFAITVYGEIDAEGSDGSKAHLKVGDISFLEDTKGKGHRTIEEGALSVFVRVPDDFDIKKWAAAE